MGIVYKQSLRNLIVTYIGFGIGAVNTLVLYTRFMSDEYYGLIGVILSTAAILTPLMAFGVPNTLVKYFSRFRDGELTDNFLSLLLLLPLLAIIPIAGFSFFANDMIGEFLARKNLIVKAYIWHIFLIGLGMAYFEVFYAWSKVQLQSVFGNFMKEIFIRLGIAILLCLLYVQCINVAEFLDLMVALYLIRTLIMMFYSLSLRNWNFKFRWTKEFQEVFNYSFLIILGGSSAIVILEIDRFMINQFIEIENVAYYTVAIFIAIVVAVPARAMHQITYPITAELLNKKDYKSLKELYQKSSLSLLIISGLVFLLIVLNLKELYIFLPPSYRGGFLVVFLIGATKVYDALNGINNSILYNSKYYRTTLVFGLFLALCTVLFNWIFIPKYGIEGAAFASFIAIFMFNTIKLFYVKQKFHIQPFTRDTFRVSALLLFLGVLFYSFDFSFHPLVNIFVKSVLIVSSYIVILQRFRISEDIISKLFSFYKIKK
ncbi:polysaccharide biosynthesis C-terminal domain-containing protein [Eudoraea chungangensis]|uniref:oligosaccharide flippase family protein n=1 Tax=Eudoraea chungangensis TaxID=1481905 RepID=UPI0023EC50E7|nr:polysaccharide biosynthesis C-terminal domain-containing protein [Eudoraea chungangensis]